MPLSEVQRILEQAIGFDPSRVSYVALENLVRKRLDELQIADIPDYARLIAQDLNELQYLIENVVVPETWFFRHRRVFEALTPSFDDLSERYHTQGRVIRCLSLACSTGEEPYSLAIALRDADIPAHALRIDGVDISKNALEKARRARYGQESFRADLVIPPAEHFSEQEAGYQVDPSITQRVSFTQLNVLDTTRIKALGLYDIIFCRNMLIYFSPHRQRSVLEQIQQNLTDSGILVVSSTEAPLVTEHLGMSQPDPGIPVFFAAQHVPKVAVTDQDLSPTAHSEVTAVPVSTNRADTTRKFTAADLSHAWSLTDKGKLEQAAELCDQMLAKQFSIADVMYLRGVIAMADESYPDAEQYFRQHLVFQPDHLNALRYRKHALMALGRTDEADWCENRIDRIMESKQAASS
ncbi:MAG: CheR family methyltransferase [bacterium]